MRLTPTAAAQAALAVRIRLLAAVVLACAPLCALADDALDVVRAVEGYRISRPTAQWQVREMPAPAGTHHALKLELAAAPAEVSLTIYVGDVPSGSSAEALCSANAASWKARATGPVARETISMCGGDAPALRCDVDAAGTLLRVRQAYVVRDGEAFLAQCLAPAAEFGKHESAFAEALKSFELLPADSPRADDRRIRLLAASCGADVPRARTWAEAARRAASEDRLILVVFEMYRGLPVPPLADSTTFMDEDVVALCQERFVVLTWSDAVVAPFAAPAAYGFGPHTFGQGVLFATPEGKVVGGVGMLEPSLVDEAARAALAACPVRGPVSGPTPDARKALLSGDLRRAERLLEKPTNSDDWILRARLMQRLHRADDALAALDAALAGGADRSAVAGERGLVLLRAGRILESIAAFDDAGDSRRSRYWRAVARAVSQGVDAVRPELLALTAGDGPDRWSKRAAAMLVGRGVASGAEAVVWPDASIVDEVRADALPRATADVERAQADALAFLLRTQRPDGTWPVPMSYSPDPTMTPTVAVTAIAGAALIPFRGRPDVDAALARAVAAVLRARIRLVGTSPGLFDYTVWAQVFSLRFLVAAAKSAPAAEAATLKDAAADIVQALAATRHPSGGWSYVRLEGAGASADNSISFLTSASYLALRDARDVGVKFDDDLLDRAADLVANLRRKDGTWAYQTATNGIADASEAALRGPLCALTLRRAGRTPGIDDIERTVAALVAQRDACLREAGKPLCHTAPDGTSAYYLLYGFRFAAEALRELPAATSAPARRALLDAVLRLRRTDGSFCDFPPIGPAYGTAMALETMRLLR